MKITLHESAHRHVTLVSKMEDEFVAFLLVFISNLLAVYSLNLVFILLVHLAYLREQVIYLEHINSSSQLVIRRRKNIDNHMLEDSGSNQVEPKHGRTVLLITLCLRKNGRTILECPGQLFILCVTC